MHILLVEDNEGDILLTTDALEDANMGTKLTVVKDGKEAIEFFQSPGSHKAGALPDLVLLDVNLPKKNGHEVLKYIKAEKELRHIPVIMLTTSSSQKDINQAYENYANSYITKPMDADEFLSVVTAIENYWVSIVKLPTNKIHNDKG